MKEIKIEKFPPLILSEEEVAGKDIFVIGDIHGCINELIKTLAWIDRTSTNRIIISVGDVVDRGPDSNACLTLLRTYGTKLVLGNHEDKILRALVPGNEVKLNDDHKHTISELNRANIDYMQAARRYIQIPSLNTVVVHGGFFSHLPIEEQNYKSIIRLRNYREGTTNMPKDIVSEEGMEFWASIWAGKALPKPFVVYGHEVRECATYDHGSVGIDTGCVFGGNLTTLHLKRNSNTVSTFTAEHVEPSVRTYWQRKK